MLVAEVNYGSGPVSKSSHMTIFSLVKGIVHPPLQRNLVTLIAITAALTGVSDLKVTFLFGTSVAVTSDNISN